MANGSKPTILLVPGAFTTPACYSNLIDCLLRTGFSTVSAALPSAEPEDPKACSAGKDSEYLLHQYLFPLLAEGTDVVVFAHSFGATCLSGEAGEVLEKRAREAIGAEGGVLGLVYISFATVPEGMSQLEYLGGQWPGFCKLDTPRKGLLTFDPVAETLYNDVNDQSTLSSLVDSHIGTATAVFTTPVHAPLWADPSFDGRRVAVKTMKDNTFPPAAQDMFYANCGVQWEMREVEGGHCAFIAKAEEVAGIIKDACESWMSG